MRTTLIAFSVFLSLAASAPLRHVVERRSLNSLWTPHPTAEPSSDFVLPLRIGLTQQNLEYLEEELYKVSNPDSDSYGAHWTPARVADFFKPKDEAVNAVMEWLVAEAGLVREKIGRSRSGQWVEARVTVEQAEKLLDTKYKLYEHADGEMKRIACEEYSIPAHLSEHIEIITPTLHFDQPHNSNGNHHTKRAGVSQVVNGKARSLGSPSSGSLPKAAPEGFTGKLQQLLGLDLKTCANITTLDCLRAQYNLPSPFLPLAPSKNTIGIVEYTPQAYVPSDLDLFFKQYSPSQVGERPVLESIDNGVVQTDQTGFDVNGESNLDLQYAMGLLGAAQPVRLYQVGDEIQGASFNNLLDGIDATYCTYEGGDDPSQDGIYPANVNCGVAPTSNVISTSYGYNEADLTPQYEQRQCAEYAKLGLMGVSMIFSSGDYGVAGNGGQCINPADGSYTTSAAGTKFNPAFPSTCPYVTSVGATQIRPGTNVHSAESACETVIYSGGGFSNVFPMPSYQSAAVGKYFKTHAPSYSATQFNNSQMTRGYPDVAANGANYNVYIDGAPGLVYGTSASAPVFASILTMVNDRRIAIGKKPVGFINPSIYSDLFKGAFTDIHIGGNQGCGTPGFTAVPGWDPVTGLGTPNYPGLLAAFLLLP